MFRIRDKILVTFLSVVIIPIIITGIFFGVYMTKLLRQDEIADTFYIVLGVLALLLVTGVVTAAFIFSRKLTRPLYELVK